ncbi:YceI family protein [Frankia sp. AgB32]|uniref:YceI family protein n=1 Tax=Frankia sp. AgB32 TaxID=631119 RepID=UPI0020101ADD|nr:YceI family protein [Frankia sp. AgB32]MCK9893146.1 YceI family protein [Frankia sp. AgB32]
MTATLDPSGPAESPPRRRRRRPRLLVVLLGAVLALAVLVVGGTTVYINVIKSDPPEEFALAQPSGTESIAPTGSLSGGWRVASGSEVGYRVKEVLFGQDTTAAGRTTGVTGSLTIDDPVASAASFTVQMATIASDESRRDDQFRGRIMDTGTFPTATFTLTEPVAIGAAPPDSRTTRSSTAKGDLTLHGTTRRVSMTLQSRWDGTSIRTVGQLPIVFADYGIPNPNFPGISTENHGIMEVSLVFTRTSPAPATTATPTP